MHYSNDEAKTQQPNYWGSNTGSALASCVILGSHLTSLRLNCLMGKTGMMTTVFCL